MPFISFDDLCNKLSNVQCASKTKVLDIARCLHETHKGFRIYETHEGNVYDFRLCLTLEGVDHFAVFNLQRDSFSLNLFIPENYLSTIKKNQTVFAKDANNWIRISGGNIAAIETYEIIGLIVIASYLRSNH